VRAHSIETAAKFCMVINLYVMIIFTGSITPPALAKIFGDMNADVQSVSDS